MRSSKNRSRFSVIKVLNKRGEVDHVYNIDERGKPVLQASAKIEDKPVIPKIHELSKLMPKLAKYDTIESPVCFDSMPFDHDQDSSLLFDTELLVRDFRFDLNFSINIDEEIEVRPDPFFL